MITWNAPVVAGAFATLSPIAGSSSAANGSMTATLAAAAAKLTFIEGFDMTSGNATVASTQVIQVTGVANGPLYYDVNVLANDTISTSAGGGQLSVRFPEPLPASASNTAILVVVPALGGGNAAAAVTAYGFQTPLASGQT